MFPSDLEPYEVLDLARPRAAGDFAQALLGAKKRLGGTLLHTSILKRRGAGASSQAAERAHAAAVATSQRELQGAGQKWRKSPLRGAGSTEIDL